MKSRTLQKGTQFRNLTLGDAPVGKREKKQKSGASCLGKPGGKPRLFAVEGFGHLGEKGVEINFEKRLKGGRLE